MTNNSQYAVRLDYLFLVSTDVIEIGMYLVDKQNRFIIQKMWGDDFMVTSNFGSFKISSIGDYQDMISIFNSKKRPAIKQTLFESMFKDFR